MAAARSLWRFWKRSMPLMTTARSTLTVTSRPANRSFNASSRLPLGWAAAKALMAAVACSMGTRRLVSVGSSLPISSLSRQCSSSSTGGPSHICAEVSLATLCWIQGQSALGSTTFRSAAMAAPAQSATTRTAIDLEADMSPSSARLATPGEQAFRGVVGKDRRRQEYGREAQHHSQRYRLDLAVEREADQLHRVGERVGAA